MEGVSQGVWPYALRQSHPVVDEGHLEPAGVRPSPCSPPVVYAARFAGMWVLLCSFFFPSRGGSLQCLRDPAPLIL